MVGGIKAGIEKASKVMMPALLVILIVLVIRALTLPNIGEGITYYLKPDLSKMSIGLVAAAVGQCFFSLNIGTTGMVNYGSYLPDSENIPSSTVKIVIADFVVAFLAGLIIIPSAFAFGIDVGSGRRCCLSQCLLCSPVFPCRGCGTCCSSCCCCSPP